MCGVGKTLISLWVTQKLMSNTILIGVPNILLVNQWKEVIHNLFQNVPCLVVEEGVNVTTITSFLETNEKNCIILTTYTSSHKVYEATKKNGFRFAMKINDECHHLTSKNINTKEKHMLIC